MKYISIIRKKGLAYFFNAAKTELRKKIFVVVQKLSYRDSDACTYSQYAEDLLLHRLCDYKKDGFYIDVGANDPIVLSNTKKFYDLGWSGVNIEPNSNNFQSFIADRECDINLNVGVGSHTGSMSFYKFVPDTLSTFSKKVADTLTANGISLIGTETVHIMPLADVFKSIKKDRVDFISIDTEGHDMEVLMSNDWGRYRAHVICIEDESGTEYDDFFKKYQYRKYAYNGLNSFFVDDTAS